VARLFQIGDVCGGYQVLRFLGAGGFAEVYEAVDASGAHRALKILAGQSPGARLGARLAREVEALARIEHVNVVRLYEAGVEDDRVYLVLELVLGSTLRRKLRGPDGPVPLGEVVRWVQKACEGVAEAHRVGVIHRDLKPANILVTPEGVVKVIDFGIAKLRSWSAPSNDHLVGTALYMAPELLYGQASDARSDVYAMGVILYEALSGAHPLGLSEGDATLFKVLQAHMEADPRPIREIAPAVPPALAALVHAALARDPDRRVHGMAALARELEHELAELSTEERVSAPALAPADITMKTSPLAMTSSTPDLDRTPTTPAPSFDEERAAMPPPAPRAEPDSPRRSAAAVVAPAAGSAGSGAAEPVRPSLSRGSSAVPVVADAGLWRAPRRRLLRPVAAAVALLAVGAVLWAATARPYAEAPEAPASHASGAATSSGYRTWPRPARGCAL
jgi:eukaryotic-like serine/threonine-protein kinase